jgi:hypothetical protein
MTLPDTHFHQPLSLSLSLMGYNASYALNGKIMLCSVTILFFLVLIIVCFHSWRCFLHCHHRRNSHRRRQARHLFHHPITPNATTTTTDQGLDPFVLKALSTFTYSSKTHDSPPECAVCLSEFEDGEQGRALHKCGHTFHVDCIDTWFQSHSKCPLCRAPVQADISAEMENQPAGSWTDPSQRKAPEMGCSSFQQPVSLGFSDGHRKPILELVGVVVEAPRLRGLDEIGLASPGGHGFKSSVNRVLSMKRIWSI